MFKKLTKRILKLVDDDGELQSFASVTESRCVDMLSIVKIVKSNNWFNFKKKRYHYTGVKLQELLQGQDTVDFGEWHQQSIGAVEFMEEKQGNAGLQFVVAPITKGEITSEGHHTLSTTQLKLESMSASPYELLRKFKSTVDEGHLLIQEMKRNKRILGLGVIYEVMKNTNPVTVQQETKGKGDAKWKITDFVSVDAGCSVYKKDKVNLDAGCTLGFKVHLLPLETKSHGRLDVEMRGFSGSRPDMEFQVCSDFAILKMSVEEDLHDFGEMDQSIKKLIWDPLYKTLNCPQALYALDCMLEEGCIFTDSSSLLDVPENVRLSVQDLLKVVGLDTVEPSNRNNLLKPIGLLVGALSELDEEAVTLIVDLDSEVRGQLLKLVEGVLEQVYSMDGGVPERNGQFSENTMSMATKVLDSCGLQLAENSLDPSLGSPGAPDAALMALYITLKGLNLLLGP